MRFLADESCDFIAVQALRAAGHDVVAVAEDADLAALYGVLSKALNQAVKRNVATWNGSPQTSCSS
jgi:hypothetical protein